MQEVPANASPAVGEGTLIVNPVTFEYSLTVVYSGLTTPITAAHFHRAAFGINGPVIIHLGAQASPIINNGTFTASQYPTCSTNCSTSTSTLRPSPAVKSAGRSCRHPRALPRSPWPAWPRRVVAAADRHTTHTHKHP
ncbi:MAG: CHRD domain-containing protein [Phycisphaeraceae bacterium]|nr:CHRD domain-containing protein [Phycisphaeraceae bacterium]